MDRNFRPYQLQRARRGHGKPTILHLHFYGKEKDDVARDSLSSHRASTIPCKEQLSNIDRIDQICFRGSSTCGNIYPTPLCRRSVAAKATRFQEWRLRNAKCHPEEGFKLCCALGTPPCLARTLSRRTRFQRPSPEPYETALAKHARRRVAGKLEAKAKFGKTA